MDFKAPAYNKTVMKTSTGAKMADVPSSVSTKMTPMKSQPINAGVKTPTTGSSNPMSAIKGKSASKNGGAIC